MNTIDGTIMIVGIGDNADKANIKIYPNPSSGIFTFTGATGQIEVFDIYGRPVLTTKESKIDLSNFPRGVYTVKVQEVVSKVILH